MNTNQLIKQVGDLLETHRPVGSGRYIIFANYGGLGFCEAALLPIGALKVITLLSRDVNEGPTIKQCRRIEDRIRLFKKEEVLW